MNEANTAPPEAAAAAHAAGDPEAGRLAEHATPARAVAPSAPEGGPRTAEEARTELERARELLGEAKQESERHRRRLREFEQAEQKRTDAEKTELQKQQERAGAAEARVAELEHAAARARVAHEFELPPELAGRLHGADEEALRADAKKLARFAAAMRPAAPDINARSGGGSAPGQIDEARRKELQARFRLPSA